MKFQKYLFNMFINGWEIAKYANETGDKIELRVEKHGKSYASKTFTAEEYSNFYEKHEDIYSKALSLSNAIEEIAGWRL